MSARIAQAAALALAAGSVTGCEVSSDFLQRMETQPKYKYYQESEFYEDGRAMRVPPEYTIPREQPVGNRALTTGHYGGPDGGEIVEMPVPVTPELLALGKTRYEIVCSQCHGILGDGRSIVSENMALRLPPSLVALKDKPNGHFYSAITQGYGVMPSFAGEIPVQERWAVVAYVRALQVSQDARLEDVPENKRPELERETPSARPSGGTPEKENP